MTDSLWKLTDDEYEFIKGEVAHIIEKYRIKCIPVSGFEIACKLNISIIAYSGLSGQSLEAAMKASLDGFFLEYKGREYIFYNDMYRSYERQNWTILHELGHIVLDHTGHSDRDEAEADFFAKYAIAPPVLIDKIQDKSPNGILEAFDISEEAAFYSYEYYRKWLFHHQKTACYTAYELKLLKCYEENKGEDSAVIL